jgi:hypothetical protein
MAEDGAERATPLFEEVNEPPQQDLDVPAFMRRLQF